MAEARLSYQEVITLSITLFTSLTQLPTPCQAVDCAVSGGTMEAFLHSALAAAQGVLCAVITPVFMDFSLPCPGGIGQTLTEPQAQQLRQDRRLFYSNALVTSYFTYEAQHVLHVVLTDTDDTLRKKLRLCRSLGIPYGIVPQWLLHER